MAEVVDALQGPDRLLEPLGKGIRGLGLVGPARQGMNRSLPNRPVAGAPAQIPAKLVADLPRLPTALAIVGLKERNREAGSAVTTLRTVMLHHARLNRMQVAALPTLESLHGDNLAPGEHGHQRNAAVDRPVAWLAAGVPAHERHGARPAVALTAALLAAGVAMTAQKIKQGGRARDIPHADRLSVEYELECHDYASESRAKVCARTSAPAAMCSFVENSSGRWLHPLRHGMKIIVVGLTRARKRES